jgi:hypothetical protein
MVQGISNAPVVSWRRPGKSPKGELDTEKAKNSIKAIKLRYAIT